MPLQATSGAATYDAFGGGVPVVANYIEEVFSTYLYTATGANITVNNGIDLLGKGGMTIQKVRSTTSQWYVTDTSRGAGVVLYTNLVNGQANNGSGSGQFLSNGFVDANQFTAGQTEVSYSFRKQPKFFDVVTYTGNGGTLSVSHSLASKPGCIIIKRTDSTGDWLVCTRKSDGNIYAMYLNSTASQFYDGTEGSLWTSSSVSINWINSNVAGGFNDSGATYVMYVLAHNAGGFGLTGTDNVISCGSFTGGSTVDLGYEPQWLMYKRTDNVGNWIMLDTMRGFNVNDANRLLANTSGSEGAGFNSTVLTNTGFNAAGETSGATYIYIAIRRGPMKTPTSGTSVFMPVTRTGTGADATITSGFPTDLIITRGRTHSAYQLNAVTDRLRGSLKYLLTNSQSPYTSSDAEATGTNTVTSFANMTGVGVGSDAVGFCNVDTIAYANLALRRAPSFFDEVCFSGTGSATTVAHNLGVAPELVIVKSRNNARDWAVYSAALGPTKYLNLNTSGIGGTNSAYWNNTAPTTSAFSVGTTLETNASGWTYASYLFASAPGVSKVGSYTGTGSSQSINCGFPSGARFVMIKRTDASGAWFWWDSARGMVDGTDPRLGLNTNVGEVNANWVYTSANGFQIVTADATVNANGGSYIFLAIA